MPSFKDDDQLEIRKKIISNYNEPTMKGYQEHKEEIIVQKKLQTCNDNISGQIIIKGDVIESLRFDGQGCVISISTANVISKVLTNQTISDALEIIKNYENMLSSKEYNLNNFNELEIFKNVSKQKNRIKCARMLSDAVKEYFLEGNE